MTASSTGHIVRLHCALGAQAVAALVKGRVFFFLFFFWFGFSVTLPFRTRVPPLESGGTFSVAQCGVRLQTVRRGATGYRARLRGADIARRSPEGQ